MKVAILKDKEKIEMEKWPVPRPGPGEVLVKVSYCGICGSDIHAYNHLIFPAGTVLGHEFSGIVEETGEGVDFIGPGDSVVVRPPGICGKCEWCKRGELALCVEHFSNTIGLKLQGGFAEYVLVKDFQAIPLPSTISLKEAAQMEPLAVCVHALERSKLRLSDNVVVIGSGSIGLITMKGAFAKGARQVAMVGRNPMRQKVAEDWGATYTFDPETAKNNEKVKEKMGSIDIVFDCVGSADSFSMGEQMVRKGGQLIILGATTDTISFEQIPVLQSSIDIVNSMGYTIEDFEIAMKCQEVDMFPVDDLVNKVYPLEEITEAFNELVGSKRIIKALIQP